MTQAEINECVTELKLPKFTGKQIADWVYLKRVKSIDEMTNISIKNREIISQSYEVGRTEPLNIKTSVDGTHPDNYGYSLWSSSIEEPVKIILAKYGIK